ncbi:BRCA2-interacting transcriptional repressor EMSY-like [Mercenaria mercenaria]|uniref:BRCA2-interacting transcriptional repressor EMSY-like n=1 Tax=Mercenaria mercenaria TaxID=6596 RepID=UPI00234F0A1E|nr:BRCA2-interacting transcriptional repressor EMSY-like [Mercenaria mercenaria]
MWPELLDMTHEESKRILRRVELEAYSAIVSAFRAQGDLNKEKKKILHDLQQFLSISTERHRAEVRRAVNDEKLATIADNMSPSNTTQEWLIEGRRLVPLMPRLVPQTAFTVTANQVANMQAEKNASLPSPSQTGIRDNTAAAASSMSSPPSTPWTSRPSSPTSNVVVLPSGMSIHIKGGLNTEEDEDVQIRKRRRSTSTENMFSPSGTPVPQVTYTTTMSNTPALSPKKITISKSPQAQPRVVASGSQTQKVILVSSQGHSPQVTVAQKTAMPMGRSTVSTGTSTTNLPKSVILPLSSSIATGTSTGNISATPPYLTNTTSTVITPLTSSAVGTSTTAFLTPTITASRPRFKTVPRQKLMQVPSPRPGVVIPMSPQPVQPSPQTIQGIKPGPKPTIQIRQEGGMKIITQSVGSGASKILPKPSQITTPSGTPVVVVSAGSSAQSSVAMVTRTGSSLTGTSAGTKVLNIQTQGGKIITAPRGSSVVTVNPKTLHLTAVKNAAGISGAKPNVIVVQKTQPRRPGVPITPGTSAGGKPTTAVISSPFEKELVSFLQKQDPTKQYVVTTTTANIGRAADTQRKVIVTTSGHGDLAKQISQSLQKSRSDTSQPSSNILQDLIQAAGIVPDGNQDNQSGEVTLNLDEAQLAALTSAAQDSTQTKVTTSMPNNEWFEYDVTDEQGNTYTHTAESADTAAAIQSLLDMQANQNAAKPKVTVQRSSSVDLSQLSDHLNQQQFYTIEQAMSILNQTEKDQAAAYIQSEAQNVGTGTEDGGDEILTAVPLNVSVPQEIQTTTATAGSQGKPPDAGGGDLDPQTGMFYVQKGGTISGIKIADGQQVIVSGEGDAKKYDLLSSSLAQAQIDLDPFQFIEDGNQGNKTVEGSSSLPVIQEVANSETVSSEDSAGSSLLGSSSDSVLIQKVVGTAPITTSTPAIRIQPSSFIPLQDVIRSSAVKTSTINITSAKPAVAASSSASIHVTVEPSGLDTSYMKMEDFTSQQLSDKADFVSDVGIGHMEEIATEETVPVAGSSGISETQIEGFQSLDSQVLPGRRKRKVLSGEEIAGSPPAGSGAPGGWVRAALGVLNKVSKYRGVNRDKNDLNAATWFTQPVDPADAPDYYTIVENPMDFGTIKRKLETCKYLEFEDYHSDMMLVKDNCYLYNPEQSLVRKDCDEVFQFYLSEYEKLMEKWQKTHIGSPISKKPRTDRSPIRS